MNKGKTIQEIAQTTFADPNRSMFSGGKAAIVVPGVDGQMHALNRNDSEKNAFYEREMQEAQKVWSENDTAILEYNKNIRNLDPDYAKVIPMKAIIVRCFHIEPQKTDTGIFITPEIPVKERTQNGIGVRQTMNSPWKLQIKAVVVAVAPQVQNAFKPGDIVQLARDVVMAEKPGVDHPFVLPYAFMTSDYLDIYPPTNPSNKHFGYLRIDPFAGMIDAVLEQTPREENHG